MKLLSFLFFFILLMVSCIHTDKDFEKISGAYEALNALSYQKAYPRNDIPDDGYSRAFEHMRNAVEDYEPDRAEDVWTAAGPFNIAGRTLALAINPQDPNTVYAGTASGGLWRSRKLGLDTSWQHMPLGLPVLGVSSIAIHPSDSSIIYIGTGEVYNYSGVGEGAAFRSMRGTYGVGILKSTDAGKTWEKSLDWTYNQRKGVNAISISPTDPTNLMAATSEGLYKSTDSGETWNIILDVIMVMDVWQSPDNPNLILAGCGNFGSAGSGIYRSINGGLTFSKISEPGFPSSFQGKIQFGGSASHPEIVYASIGNGFTQNDGASWLIRSDNYGKDWNLVSQEDYSKWQGWFSHDVAVHPDNPEEIIVVGIDIFKSVDGGQILEQKSVGGVKLGTLPIGLPDGPPDYSHSDHHAVMYHPYNHDTILFANDGGLYLSFDGGESFQSANGGFQSTQFYNGFSTSNIDENFAVGGLQDNSTVIFSGDLAWKRVLGGDGSWSGINQRNLDSLYVSLQYLRVYLTTNLGEDFTFLNIPFGENDFTVFIAPFIVAEKDPQRIYAGRNYLQLSTDGGVNWTTMNGGNKINGDAIFAMDVSPTNENVLYLATAPYYLSPGAFASIDGGQTFEDISFGLPNRYPTDMHVSRQNEAEVYITMGGFGSGHVFRSFNFGVSWEDISGNLPDVPTQAIISDPDIPDKLYAGNDFGVFYTPDGGENWFLFDDGISDTYQVMDLKISKENRRLWVATHGRGAYYRPLVDEYVDNTKLNDEQLNILTFPNPTKSKFSIKLEDGQDEKFALIAIINSVGNKMTSYKVQSPSSNVIDIEVGTDWDPGIYLIVCKTEIGLQTIKVILTK